MASAMRGVGTVRKGISEKVPFKLWTTWTVGKRIFQAEGTVGKTFEHCAGGVAREQKVGGNERGCKSEREVEHARPCRSVDDFIILF